MERMASIAAWDNFYVIVGSSAAALTGLQFVVATLIATDEERRGTPDEVRAFGTPTVVHFCAALLISAINSAPWHELSHVATAFGACGFLGVAYGCVTIGRARATRTFKLVLEDWIWYVGLPLLSYGSVLIASFVLPHRAGPSLFVVGAAALLLLLIGIHNAWYTVTYLAVEKKKAK